MPSPKILDDTTAYAIAKESLPFWDLAESQLQLISRSENIVFRVDDHAGKRYVLRIHRPGYHTLNELNAEQEWTTALNESGLSVPVAVQTRGKQNNDQWYVPITVPESDEMRYVGLAEWFEGTPLRQLLEEEVKPDMFAHYFEQLGQIAARIHNQSAEWMPASTNQRHRLDAQYSLIHADLHPGNLLIKDDVLHVIDSLSTLMIVAIVGTFMSSPSHSSTRWIVPILAPCKRP